VIEDKTALILARNQSYLGHTHRITEELSLKKFCESPLEGRDLGHPTWDRKEAKASTFEWEEQIVLSPASERHYLSAVVMHKTLMSPKRVHCVMHHLVVIIPDRSVSSVSTSCDLRLARQESGVKTSQVGQVSGHIGVELTIHSQIPLVHVVLSQGKLKTDT
jgi:hypothetical protein